MLRDNFSQCNLACERQIAVVFIAPHRCSRGSYCSSGRSKIGVKILQPQDLRIVSRLSSNAIDGEARDAPQSLY
jgi:hypothetical protein